MVSLIRMVSLKEESTPSAASNLTTIKSMAELLQLGLVKSLPNVGDIVEGVVLSVSKKEVLLDLQGIATGIVRGPELYDESGQYEKINVGDTVAATIISLENERGEVECSFRSAGHQRAWEMMKQMMDSGALVNATVINANKGGLMVQVNRLQGFLPVSQLTPEHYPRVIGGDRQKILEKLQTLVGKEMEVKVIDVKKQEEKLIVSEKKAFEERQRDRLAAFAPGTVVDGMVSGITNFGAFVRFSENLEGLIHISELSWQRVDDPHALLAVGDNVQAKIIGVDGSKISLSLKQLSDDPWKKAVEQYQVGQSVNGIIRRINPYGLLVELNPTIQGLAHISQLGVTRSSDLLQIAKVGDEMEFVVTSIDAQHHRLGLGRAKPPKPTPEPGPQPSQEPAAEQQTPPEDTAPPDAVKTDATKSDENAV